MGFNTQLMVIRNRSLTDLSLVNLTVYGSLTVDEASRSSCEHLAAAEFVGGIVIFDNQFILAQAGPQLARDLSTEVVVAGFSSVSDTYIWSVVQPDGQIRSWVQSQGVTLVSEGHPVPEELQVETLDEDTLFAILLERTGITLDFAAPAVYVGSLS